MVLVTQKIKTNQRHSPPQTTPYPTNQVAAGPSLFNVVVDTDETAARLMQTLEARSLGRVCFMPLNRLRVKPVAYPDSSDVVPLLAAALEYPREVRGYVCVYWFVVLVGWLIQLYLYMHAHHPQNTPLTTPYPYPHPHINPTRWSARCSRSSA